MIWCCVLTQCKFKRKFKQYLISLYLLHALCWTVVIQAVNINIGIILMDPVVNLDYDTINETLYNARSYFSTNDLPSLGTSLSIQHVNNVPEAQSFMSTNSLDIFVAFTPFEYVSTLNLIASELDKPLVIANNFLPEKYSPNSLSLFNGFKLTSRAVLQYLEWFRWQNVAIISADDSFWQQMVTILENALIKQRFNVKHSRTISNVSNSSIVLSVLEEISQAEKAILLAMDLPDAISVLQIANSWNAYHQHAFFVISNSPYFNSTELNSNLNPVQYVKVAKTLFVISPTVSSSSSNLEQDSMVLVLEDAFICVLYGLSILLKINTTNITVNDIISTVETSSFKVNNKLYTFYEDTERYFDYVLYDYEEASSSFTMARIVGRDASGAWQQRIIRDIDAPLAPDSCFKTTSCKDDSEANISLIVSLVVCLMILTGGVGFAAMLFWKRKVKLNMTKGPNKILLEQEDLTFLHKKEMKSTKIPNGNFLDKPDLVKASEKSNRSLASLHELSEFSEIARYKGDLVYVKEVKSKGFEMKGKLFAYLRMLRDIRQENVNPLYGFLIDPLRPAMVSEFCSRGSLLVFYGLCYSGSIGDITHPWDLVPFLKFKKDVLKNENIKLDWDFKASLLTDLVRGIRYIQGSPIRYHGNLKSRNCVIDSRWVLKLTDFGMPGFRERAKMTINYEANELLWTAPEHLRDQYPGTKGSEKGDIYGLGIIMQEVILRKDPFGMTELKPSEIIQKLKHPPPLLRPSVSPQAAQPMYIQLMKGCWAENPELRPAIEEIYQQFKAISGGKKMNIVDSMFRMLEKYSNDLEDIVKERTVQLEEEKKKTDVLLFRMLPPSVAESLKTGRPVNAETFKEVTIYFSDIVGFTTISAMSTPMQVVALLNDLYTMFDATIDNYDVYKVETIGDAYMVASGLPVPNGNRHAGEIGTMALDLLSQCGTFTIRHMPEVPLRLRIGLHSGSCVAGVVGLTMPRYCLFGDTVNTASRMESTGSAFRVHISNTTKLKLDELEGYQTEYRGEVELKGKGMHKTYWLTGKDGFTKPLPEPPPANDASNHGLESVLKLRKQSNVVSPTPGSSTAPTTSEKDKNSPTLKPCPSPGVCEGSTKESDRSDDNESEKPSPETPKTSPKRECSVILKRKDANATIDGPNSLAPVAEV